MKDVRIEKKFVLGKYKENFVKNFLLLNGFIKQFPRRKISSIYLDTINFDHVKDNINGVSERKKIRLRWYDNNKTKIYFEEKNKRNFLVWKNIKEIELSYDAENFIKKLKGYFFSKSFNFTKNFNYQFVLKVSYNREYWVSADKNIRATVDTNINTSLLKNSSTTVNLSDTILEFKFHPDNEKYFRNFLNKKNYKLRSQKYSKYVRSFTELENSGLIFLG